MVAFTHRIAGRVNQHVFTGLKVLQGDQAELRQATLAAVGNADRDHVVAPVRDAQRHVVPRRHEVGNQETDRAAPTDVMQKVQRQTHVGAPLLRLKMQQVPHDPHPVPFALLRRHEFFDLVREQQQPDAVVVGDGAQRQNCAHFRRNIRLQPVDAAKLPGGADVDQQHDGQLSFLYVSFDVGVPPARRDVPINTAHVVAWRILAHLGELHAVAFEGAQVFAPKCFVDQPVCSDVQAAYLVVEFRGNHGEIGTVLCGGCSGEPWLRTFALG